VRQLAHDLKLDDLNVTDPTRYDRLRTGRIYSGDEFDDHDPLRKARRARDMRRLGLADERVVRVLGEDTASAWLTIVGARPFSAADSALLSSLVPYAAAAVRTYMVAERRQLAAAFDGDVLHRAGSGWIAFDESARVLALALPTSHLFARMYGHPPPLRQRLRELGSAVEKALVDAALTFTRDPQAAERTLILSREPRIEAILAPAPPGAGAALEKPVMVAYCRHRREPGDGRATHLARLFDLPRREAELAVLLADGRSLIEAGEAMGLTVETTRNYSKRLFAKTGARSQADLVRTVLGSCAALD
jgi:DNA-binding CsgD family transcriptional regulator